ncbi:MAG: hypothetical protein M3285_13310 [Actinomycetota bacterium]|nr:hypothetical protein [Actinomycetota bacterium]
MAVFTVLLMLEVLATTGFVDGVMEPARAGGGSYFAEGDIQGANPASADVSGITETDHTENCGDYPPTTQGADGWVFQLPEDFVLPAPFSVTGDSAAPAYDLDVFFHDETCSRIDSVATGSADETGDVPVGTRYVVVNQFLGAETHVTLCVGDPKGCVAASSNGTSAPPSTSTSPPPGDGEMSTTLRTSRSETAYRKLFTVSGVVSGDEECGEPGDHRVGLTKRILGTNETKSVDRSIPVDDDGSWSIKHRSARSAQYVAHVSPSKTCESSSSDPENVRVHVDTEVTNPPKDCDDNVVGIVRPNHQGTNVELQRHSDKKFRATGVSDTLNKDSKFKMQLPRCGLFRVVWVSQDPSNMWGSDTFKARNN